MDAFDLFRKLGAGAKFDLKRFGQDAARFKVNLTDAAGDVLDEKITAITAITATRATVK